MNFISILFIIPDKFSGMALQWDTYKDALIAYKCPMKNRIIELKMNIKKMNDELKKLTHDYMKCTCSFCSNKKINKPKVIKPKKKSNYSYDYYYDYYDYYDYNDEYDDSYWDIYVLDEEFEESKYLEYIGIKCKRENRRIRNQTEKIRNKEYNRKSKQIKDKIKSSNKKSYKQNNPIKRQDSIKSIKRQNNKWASSEYKNDTDDTDPTYFFESCPRCTKYHFDTTFINVSFTDQECYLCIDCYGFTKLDDDLIQYLVCEQYYRMHIEEEVNTKEKIHDNCLKYKQKVAIFNIQNSEDYNNYVFVKSNILILVKGYGYRPNVKKLTYQEYSGENPPPQCNECEQCVPSNRYFYRKDNFHCDKCKKSYEFINKVKDEISYHYYQNTNVYSDDDYSDYSSDY